MWKNILEPGRLLLTIWCMHIACWIAKATNTIFLHGINGCMNMLQCYVICTLPVFLLQILV